MTQTTKKIIMEISISYPFLTRDHPCQPVGRKYGNRRGAHNSVTTAQPYFSPRSNNNRCLLQKPMSPVILMIDRTTAYSDRQPYWCSMTSPHMATEPITTTQSQTCLGAWRSACSLSLKRVVA